MQSVGWELTPLTVSGKKYLFAELEWLQFSPRGVFGRQDVVKPVKLSLKTLLIGSGVAGEHCRLRIFLIPGAGTERHRGKRRQAAEYVVHMFTV